MSTFLIAGRIVASDSNEPLVGLRVEAWDKDLICDDLVGSAVSDDQGAFDMEFDESYFQEIFFDRRPDLYFKIFHKGKLVKDTKDHVQANVAPGYTPVVIEVDPTALGEPRRKEPHTLRMTLPEPDPIPSYGPSRLLHDFLSAMNAIGDDAQSRYDHALDALHNEAEQVVPEIDRALQSTAQQDFPSRWALVYTAVKMKHPTALPFLRNLVIAPLPMNAPADGHSRSILAEETMLRATAVEGIEHLAVSGNEDALQALFRAIEQPSRSIRIAAVQGILATPGGERLRARVAAMLPEEHRFMLDIKRMDVRDVPQIDDPRQFLKPGVLRRMPSAPPLSGSMQRRTARPQATGQNTGAPKLQKGEE